MGPLHDELHLALDRDVEPAPLHAWLAGATGGASTPRVASPADRVDELRHRRRASLRSGRRGTRRRRLRRVRARPRQVPPHRPRRGERSWCTSQMLTPASISRSAARSSRSTATSTAAVRASARASRSARTTTSTTSSAARRPVRCRSSSRRGCAAAICSSSATRWTTGACVSFSAASGAATGSRIARGPCNLHRSTLRVSCGMSEARRCTTSRSGHTPRSSRGSRRALAEGAA